MRGFSHAGIMRPARLAIAVAVAFVLSGVVTHAGFKGQGASNRMRGFATILADAELDLVGGDCSATRVEYKDGSAKEHYVCWITDPDAVLPDRALLRDQDAFQQANLFWYSDFDGELADTHLERLLPNGRLIVEAGYRN